MIPSRISRPVEESGVVDLLVATAVGVYVLVVVGATTGLLDGATACRGWPTCGGGMRASLADPAAAVAIGHRLAALVVFGLLVWTTAAAWRRPTGAGVRVAVTAVAALYPVQVLLGALTATGSGSLLVRSAHLVTGMGIFTGVTLALLWQLETVTAGGPDEAGGGASGEHIQTTGQTAGEHTPTAREASIPPDGDGPPGTRGSAGSAERASAETSGPTPGRGLRDRAAAYLALTKPKLMWLLCLVAVAAMAIAGGRSVDVGTAAGTLAGGVLAIGASGTFNNVLERDVDRRMDRTNDRPLVEGQIPVRNAVAFGVALTGASVAVFLAAANALAAALGVLAILFYSVVYTLVLKPNTSQNVVVGGAVGAFPALIGWAAVTETIGVPAVALGGVVFLWTPAHFYNLALAYRADYRRAEIPMLPVVADGATTRRHVLLYLVATMVAAVVLGTHARLGWAYAATAIAFGTLFLAAVVRQYREPTRSVVLRTFHASNAYLGVVLLAVVLDATLV